ncbi:hypothetical protein HY086_02925 [Candidatus Gottesmanbacteria bacterium]|nr:hypothetical protein [Candidatus Gottesmanbacteria bacterium]
MPNAPEDGKLSRREALQWFGGLGLVILDACATRGPDVFPSSSPTPTVGIEPQLLASLRASDPTFNEATWARSNFEPQLSALEAQFDKPTVSAARLGIAGYCEAEAPHQVCGYVMELQVGQDAYTYVGANQDTGKGGFWLRVPPGAHRDVRDDAIVVFKVNPGRYVYRYVDESGNVLDPVTGMMTQAHPTSRNSQDAEAFSQTQAARLTGMVRDRVVTNRDARAQFYLSIRDDATDVPGQFYALVETIGGNGEQRVVLLTQQGEPVVLAAPDPNSMWRLNHTTGRLDLYSRADNKKLLDSVGVNLQAKNALTLTPTRELPKPTATATITLTPRPEATPKPVAKNLLASPRPDLLTVQADPNDPPGSPVDTGVDNGIQYTVFINGVITEATEINGVQRLTFVFKRLGVKYTTTVRVPPDARFRGTIGTLQDNKVEYFPVTYLRPNSLAQILVKGSGAFDKIKAGNAQGLTSFDDMELYGMLLYRPPNQ